MARELSKENLRVVFFDRLSDSDLELFYRMPTSAEQVDYDNSLMTRTRNKITSNIGAARMKYGKAILKGIGDDTFTVQKDGGYWLPLHSHDDSEHYAEDWKDIVCKMAPDVVSRLGFHVFEGSLEKAEGEDPT